MAARVRLLFATLLALAAGGAGAARADPISFSYAWGTTKDSVLTGTNGSTGNGLSTGSVAVALAPDGSSAFSPGGGPARIAVATFTTTSSAGGENPADRFNTRFGMTLHLTDAASGQSGDLTFSAALRGELT